MKLKILYDNKAKSGFESGWGFSCLIEIEDEKILFDTGWDGKTLLHNMKKFGIEPSEIDKVVISHRHWDHSGGLGCIREKEMDVYLPKSFTEYVGEETKFRFKLHEVGDPQKITDRVWSTGELKNETEEQALAVETENGILVIVGCSHPGVDKILKAASEFGEIKGIVGGLHGFDKYEALEGLDLIVATHCTKNKEKIAELYPKEYSEGKAGLVIEI